MLLHPSDCLGLRERGAASVWTDAPRRFALAAAVLLAPCAAWGQKPAPVAGAGPGTARDPVAAISGQHSGVDIRTVALGADATADTAALSTLLSRLAASGGSLWVPEGLTFVIDATITVPGYVPIHGGGTIALRGTDGPAITYVIAAQTSYTDFGPVIFANQDRVANSNSAGVQFQSADRASTTAFFQYNTIHDVSCTGFSACVSNAMAVGLFDWNRLVNITWKDGPLPARYGVEHTLSSGTGNTYDGFKGGGSATGGASVRFDAGAVGDVLFRGAHLLGANNVILSFGPALTYKSRILVADSQADAGMLTVFANDNPNDVMSGVDIQANNVGGGLNPGLGLPYLTQSIVQGKGVSRWDASATLHTLNGGRQTVTAGHIQQVAGWGATTVDIKVNGLVGGVGSGYCHAIYALTVAGNTAQAVLESKYCSIANLFDIQPAVSGLMTAFTVGYTALPGSPDSTAEMQISASGYTFKLVF